MTTTLPAESASYYWNGVKVAVDLATYPFSACLNATSDAECLSAYRPPLRHSLDFTLTMTLTYAILGIFGVFGNALVILVVSRMREMRTAANLYLLNLACADLMLVVTGLPLELQEYWFAYPHTGGPLLGPFLCVFRHWASEACAYATVLTICAFTFERTCTIYWPRLFNSPSTNYRRVGVVIGAVWILAGSFAALVSYQWRIDYVTTPDGRQLFDSAICIPLEELSSPALFIVPVILFFFVPMILITLLYLLIWRAVKRMSFLMRYGSLNSSHLSAPNSTSSQQQQIIVANNHNNNNNCSPIHRQYREDHRYSNQSNRRFSPQMVEDRRTSTVIKVQTAVTLTFFVCWAPFHSQRLVVTFGHPEQWTEQELRLYHIFNAIAGVLYYLEACINPAIYSLLSKKFRCAFHSTLVMATNATTCSRFFKTPHKLLMTRLFYRRDFRNVGQQIPMRQHHVLKGIDSVVAANVALFEQQRGQSPQRIISPTDNRREIVEIPVRNACKKPARGDKCPNNNNSAVVFYSVMRPSDKKSDSRLAICIGDACVSPSGYYQKSAALGGTLCQFCKHAPRSCSMIPQSPSSNDNNNNNNINNEEMGLRVNTAMSPLRRYSDQPTVILAHRTSEPVKNRSSLMLVDSDMMAMPGSPFRSPSCSSLGKDHRRPATIGALPNEEENASNFNDDLLVLTNINAATE